MKIKHTMEDNIWQTSKNGNLYMKRGAFHTVVVKRGNQFKIGLIYHHSGEEWTEWTEARFDTQEEARQEAETWIDRVDGALNAELAHER